LFAALDAFYATFHKRFALISSDARTAYAGGLNVRLWDFLFYAAFAVVVVSFVRVAGVLGIAAASLVGLWGSYRLDLPIGAVIVCACGLALTVVSIITSVRRRSQRLVV